MYNILHCSPCKESPAFYCFVVPFWRCSFAARITLSNRSRRTRRRQSYRRRRRNKWWAASRSLVGVLSSYDACSYVLYMRWYGLMLLALSWTMYFEFWVSTCFGPPPKHGSKAQHQRQEFTRTMTDEQKDVNGILFRQRKLEQILVVHRVKL